MTSYSNEEIALRASKVKETYPIQNIPPIVNTALTAQYNKQYILVDAYEIKNKFTLNNYISDGLIKLEDTKKWAFKYTKELFDQYASHIMVLLDMTAEEKFSLCEQGYPVFYNTYLKCNFVRLIDYVVNEPIFRGYLTNDDYSDMIENDVNKSLQMIAKQQVNWTLPKVTTTPKVRTKTLNSISNTMNVHPGVSKVLTPAPSYTEREKEIVMAVVQHYPVVKTQHVASIIKDEYPRASITYKKVKDIIINNGYDEQRITEINADGKRINAVVYVKKPTE